MKYLVLLLAIFSLSACESMNFKSEKAPSAGRGVYKVGAPYIIDGTTYYPQEDYAYDETGIASWYGPGFHGKTTANGETFDENQLTAAHRTLPMPSLVRVTNLENGKSVVARINDRGPFARGRIIDMSKRGAELLGFKNNGVAKVRVQIMAEESMAIAEAARHKGTFIAGKGGPVPKEAEIAPQPVERVQAASLQPLETVDVAPKATVQSPAAQAIERTEETGRFMPPVRATTLPVSGQQNVYVQAGAFSVQENAIRLADRLKAIGPAQVSEFMNGAQRFYRVRLPAASVAEADRILSQVIAQGQKNARIIVDN